MERYRVSATVSADVAHPVRESVGEPILTDVADPAARARLWMQANNVTGTICAQVNGYHGVTTMVISPMGRCFRISHRVRFTDKD